MRSPNGIEALGSPVFVLAVALLVANDFVLKPAFHNGLTGKLSDFAGLAAFAIFLCALRPERRCAVALGITAAFVFWKSPYSQGAIDGFNAVSPLRIGRTVDYTDLAALPVVWWVCASWPLRAWPARRWLLQALAGVSVFAFTATSMPIDHYDVREAVDFPGPATSDETGLQRLVDDVAARHNLRCHVCEPLSNGRSYIENPPRSWDFSLTVTLDSTGKRLVYDVRDAVQGRPVDHRRVDLLRADLDRALRSRAPDIAVAAVEEPRKKSLQFVVLSGDSSGSYTTQGNQADARRAAAIVTEVATASGLKPIVDTRDFYTGRLIGPNRYDRELTVMMSVVITGDMYFYVSAVPEYRDHQRAIATDLGNRLLAAFGKERAKPWQEP